MVVAFTGGAFVRRSSLAARRIHPWGKPTGVCTQTGEAVIDWQILSHTYLFELKRLLAMLRCREISELVSESMERELPFSLRVRVWMHLAMCRMCFRFASQVRFLRRAVHEHPDRLAPPSDSPDAVLPEQARIRIKAALRDHSE